MKKAIAITLALVMVALFAGCGLQAQLTGTKWELVQQSGLEKTVITMSFERGHVYKESLEYYYNGELVADESFSNTAKWTIDGDELTVTYDDGTSFTFKVEIDGDKLTLYEEIDGEKYGMILTRVEE